MLTWGKGRWAVSQKCITVTPLTGTSFLHIYGAFEYEPEVRNDPGSLYVFGKLPTYPSPKPTLTLFSHLGQNVYLGVG